MTSDPLEAYLSRLERELTKRRLVSARIVEEAREHLVDAIEEGRQRGLSVDAAKREAVVRFGAPETVAAHFATEKYCMRNRLLFMLTSIARLMRRTKPEAGKHHDVATISVLMRRKEPYPSHFHDISVPSRCHFKLRLKRRYRDRFKRMSSDEQRRFIAEKRERGEDVSAFETDPRERLFQFLREFGRRTFGSGGTLESLTLLEDTTDSSKCGGRYLAAFGSGTKMIWTVTVGRDGGVSFDGTSSPA
jgi:hypothetical protein